MTRINVFLSAQSIANSAAREYEGSHGLVFLCSTLFLAPFFALIAQSLILFIVTRRTKR